MSDYNQEGMARLHRLLQREFPDATVEVVRPPIGPFERLLLLNPGQSKVLDLSDTYLAAHAQVKNLDELLVADGVIEALKAATNQQRVIRRSDGLFTEDA